jgi:hypothetical protein
MPWEIDDLGEYTGGSVYRWKEHHELNIDGDSLLYS